MTMKTTKMSIKEHETAEEFILRLSEAFPNDADLGKHVREFIKSYY